MLTAFGAGPEAPRMGDSPWILVIGLLCIGILWLLVGVTIAGVDVALARSGPRA